MTAFGAFGRFLAEIYAAIERDRCAVERMNEARALERRAPHVDARHVDDDQRRADARFDRDLDGEW